MLYRKGEFIRSWWSNNGGAICLSDSHDDPCWPGIAGAEFAVKGVKLYSLQTNGNISCMAIFTDANIPSSARQNVAKMENVKILLIFLEFDNTVI